MGILFERKQGFVDMITDSLIALFGIDTDRYPFLILFCSLMLWEISFLVSTLSAAMIRSKKWDNRTPRDLEEKKRGLPLRAQSAHYNEAEQFSFMFAAILSALYLKTEIAFINFCCSGWILHRFPLHICYWLNIDGLRSFFYICSFHFTLLLIASSIYSKESVINGMDLITQNTMSSLLTFD